MPELRWTLLIIGVLFVVILAWWERRRRIRHRVRHLTLVVSPGRFVSDDGSWGGDGASGNSRVNS